MEDWQNITPTVDSSSEFFEIVNDFGNPLEIVREAISNSVDWGASFLKITFSVGDYNGSKRLFIKFQDDGSGMDFETLGNAFWGLGHSEARNLKQNGKEIIGEKGHGTKIYLRSEYVSVLTHHKNKAYESDCEYPIRALAKRTLHSPRIRETDPVQAESGTEITVVGYNDNERSTFVQDILRDYIIWFTAIGSVGKGLSDSHGKDFKVLLKAIGREDYEEIQYGHIFPEENSNIAKLFDEYEEEAADYFVRRYKFENNRLKRHPETTFDMIVSIEGDQIKRSYNPMIRERMRKDSGKYKVADRYGLWICKDFIPVSRINEWVSGFGTGSNSITMVHGFVNCQDLKLTANRGTIANTDPQILDELKETVQEIMEEIDTDLRTDGIYTLRGWQKESKTLKQEKSEFDQRIKSIKSRASTKLQDRTILEPLNESELFGLFTIIYAEHPDLFDFEPLDYNTYRGIDIVARNKTDNTISESDFWYVELKYRLKKEFNHAFKYLRWILCWDFDKNIVEGNEFYGIEDDDVRFLEVVPEEGSTLYFLNNRKRATKIQIIRLKQLLQDKLDVSFRIR